MTKVTAAVWLTEALDPPRWRERIAAKSARAENGCILWTGRLDRHGYGVFFTCDRPGRQTGAHRAAWLAHRGPIARGLVIDHLCRNRACVNVDHMEVVTVKANTRRGNAGRHRTGVGTHCRRGHEYTEENTHWRESGGYRARVCRECRRLHKANARASRAA